jgi:indolepyruvate ferredoxin oxidoreductase
MERSLIENYRATMSAALARLDAENYDTVLALAEIPDMIRGFGPVKLEGAVKAAAERERLSSLLDKGNDVSRSAA